MRAPPLPNLSAHVTGRLHGYHPLKRRVHFRAPFGGDSPFYLFKLILKYSIKHIYDVLKSPRIKWLPIKKVTKIPKLVKLYLAAAGGFTLRWGGWSIATGESSGPALARDPMGGGVPSQKTGGEIMKLI
eukprot:768739-Hanusia_phi.AAC.8